MNDGFEGGGTQFVQLEGAPIFRPAVGAALLFSGKNRHRGVETTEGVRYILAGFVDVRKGFVDKRKRSRSRSPRRAVSVPIQPLHAQQRGVRQPAPSGTSLGQQAARPSAGVRRDHPAEAASASWLVQAACGPHQSDPDHI